MAALSEKGFLAEESTQPRERTGPAFSTFSEQISVTGIEDELRDGGREEEADHMEALESKKNNMKLVENEGSGGEG